jgi:hypothetical protein
VPDTNLSTGNRADVPQALRELLDVEADAARLIRGVLAALPAETPRDLALAARLEGAALALDVITAAS